MIQIKARFMRSREQVIALNALAQYLYLRVYAYAIAINHHIETRARMLTITFFLRCPEAWRLSAGVHLNDLITVWNLISRASVHIFCIENLYYT